MALSKKRQPNSLSSRDFAQLDPYTLNESNFKEIEKTKKGVLRWWRHPRALREESWVLETELGRELRQEIMMTMKTYLQP